MDSGHIPPSQYCKYGLGLIVIYMSDWHIHQWVCHRWIYFEKYLGKYIGCDAMTWSSNFDGNTKFADMFQAGKARTWSWNAFVSSISWRALFTWLDKCYHHRQNHHQHQQSSSCSSALEKSVHPAGFLAFFKHFQVLPHLYFRFRFRFDDGGDIVGIVT